MRTRIITGIILAAVLIPLLFVPTSVFIGTMALFTLIGCAEFYRMVNKSFSPLPLFITFVLMTMAIFFVTTFTLNETLTNTVFLPMILIVLIVYLMGRVFIQQRDTATLMQGSLYLGIPFATLSFIHAQGMMMLIYLLMLAMLTDMFAYFVGIKFGKHKLAPKVSPKKTIEGALGGTLVAVGIATPFALYHNLFGFEQNIGSIFIVIVFGILVSFLAQIGDLVASAFKRQFAIKDFSNLFPGHGGVLDRFDSSMFASVILTLAILLTEVM